MIHLFRDLTTLRQDLGKPVDFDVFKGVTRSSYVVIYYMLPTA